MTQDPIAGEARRAFGVPARHYKRTDGNGAFAGPLCGQRAADGGGWARTTYTTDTLRVPNGCLQTQLDFIKATAENVPFLCHQADRKGWPCHAWYAARVAMRAAEKHHGRALDVRAPWEFSPPDEKD